MNDKKNESGKTVLASSFLTSASPKNSAVFTASAADGTLSAGTTRAIQARWRRLRPCPRKANLRRITVLLFNLPH